MHEYIKYVKTQLWKISVYLEPCNQFSCINQTVYSVNNDKKQSLSKKKQEN